MNWFVEMVRSCAEEGTGWLLEDCLAAARSLLAVLQSAVKQRGRHPVVRATHSSSETFGNVSVSVQGVSSSLLGLFALAGMCLDMHVLYRHT